jgi:hypothetical protein
MRAPRRRLAFGTITLKSSRDAISNKAALGSVSIEVDGWQP